MKTLIPLIVTLAAVVVGPCHADTHWTYGQIVRARSAFLRQTQTPTPPPVRAVLVYGSSKAINTKRQIVPPPVYNPTRFIYSRQGTLYRIGHLTPTFAD